MVCNCSAYSFPHRPNSGKCEVSDPESPTCKVCGKNCDVVTVDNGIGPYEFWGQYGIDEKICLVSSCCEGEVYIPNKPNANMEAWAC